MVRVLAAVTVAWSATTSVIDEGGKTPVNPVAVIA